MLLRMLMSVWLGSLMFVADVISFLFVRQLTAAFWIVFQVVCVFLGGFAGVVTERRDRRYLRGFVRFRASCVCSLAVQVGRWFFCEPWIRDGGIPQGCPLCMIFTVAGFVSFVVSVSC